MFNKFAASKFGTGGSQAFLAQSGGIIQDGAFLLVNEIIVRTPILVALMVTADAYVHQTGDTTFDADARNQALDMRDRMMILKANVVWKMLIESTSDYALWVAGVSGAGSLIVWNTSYLGIRA